MHPETVMQCCVHSFPVLGHRPASPGWCSSARQWTLQTLQDNRKISSSLAQHLLRDKCGAEGRLWWPYGTGTQQQAAPPPLPLLPARSAAGGATPAPARPCPTAWLCFRSVEMYSSTVACVCADGCARWPMPLRTLATRPGTPAPAAQTQLHIITLRHAKQATLRLPMSCTSSYTPVPECSTLNLHVLKRRLRVLGTQLH